MYPWFQFKGIDSRDEGLWVSLLPSIQRPAERVEKVDIYGRAGSLTLLEDANVYEEYEKSCTVTVRAESDFRHLHKWLQGSGDLIFSNEPDMIYKARVTDAVDFKKLSNDLRQAEITFTVYPFKRQTGSSQTLLLSANENLLWNPGDIISRPVITVVGTGNMILTVNSQELTIAGDSEESGTYILDCAAEYCTDSEGNNLSASITGDYPVLRVGSNVLSYSGEGVESVTVKAVWWYL